MTTDLRKPALDGGTYLVVFQFFDELDNAVVPTNIKWSLYNEHGEIVNGKEDVIITPPASQVVLVLSGDDLLKASGAVRQILVESNYDSTYGTYLPLNDAVLFPVHDLVGV